MDPALQQAQVAHQQAAAAAAHQAAQQQAANRQMVVDARRFEKLEQNVSKLLELTQLMLNRQEELNDRHIQRETHLQNEVSFAEERLQLAMDGSGVGHHHQGHGHHPHHHHHGGIGGAGEGGSSVGEDDEDDDRDPPDMAYPPIGMQFRPNFGAKKPLEGLLDNINLWAKEHGYKCATLRSTQKPGERVRVAIRCALGGEARYKITDESGETLIRTKSGQLRKPYRKRTSKKTGCQFGFILGETGQGTNIFEVRYHPNGSPAHNHSPMDV